jgi:hypothetical protein
MRLVIDANISQSAGSSDVPSSIYSRECLNEVLDQEHRAVFSQQLLTEWREHSSFYARKWLRSMTARKRIENIEGEEFAMYADRACACLEHDRSKEALRKDFHLAQSALASDRTIVSNEREFPAFVAVACTRVRVLSRLYYANPVIEGESCTQWIREGAEKDASRRIDIWAANHGS